MFHHFFFRFFLFPLQPLLLHIQAGAAVVSPAQFENVLAQPAIRAVCGEIPPLFHHPSRNAVA
jgi:hypothetical protein